MRIGEALVRDGVVSQAELDEALELQKSNGQKLGTLLVQLGALDQKKLYEYLARRFAGAHMFKPGEEPKIAADAVLLVPKKIAEYYRLVPMTADSTTIHVALLDPTRVSALAAVRSHTKKNVVPHVVSEDVMDALLYRHYGVEPPKRVTAKARPITVPNLVIKDVLEGKDEPQLFGQLDLSGEDSSVDDIPMADANDLLEEIVDDGPGLDLDVRGAIVPKTVEAAKAAIDAARSEEQVAAAVLGAAIAVYSRAALFRVHLADGSLTAWDSGGESVSRRLFERVSVRIEPRSIFGVALSGRTPFLGNVAKTGENTSAFAAMNWGMPRSAFCVGLWQHTPIALLYADNGPESQMNVNVTGIVDVAARAAEKLAKLRTK